MVKLSSVKIDLPAMRMIPIGEPTGGGSELECAKGEVCSFVCVTLPDLRRGRHIRVSVVVTTDLPSKVPVSIFGRQTSGATVADIPETVMKECGSAPTHRSADVMLDASKIISDGVHSNCLTWEWHARVGEDGVAPLGSSRHEVFVLAGPPTAPWASVQPAGPAEQLPWPSALRRATNWAAGVQTTDEAARRIVSTMFDLGCPTRKSPPKLVYSGDHSGYVVFLGQPAVFFCKRFIDDLEKLPTVRMSCVEASAAVTTLANLVGCDLRVFRIESNSASDFDTNCVIPLGAADPTCPVNFRKHQVGAAMTGVIEDALVYDVVLQIDPDDRPAQAGPRFVKPIAMTLGDRTTPTGRGAYLPQLALGAHLPNLVVFKLPAPLIKIPGPQHFMLPSDKARYESYLRELEAASKAFVKPTQFKIDGYGAEHSLADEPSIDRASPLLPIPPLSRTKHEPLSDARKGVLESLFWKDPDPKITRSAMAELLASADQAPHRVPSTYGPTYLSADRTTLYMLLDGAAAVLQSIGTESVDLSALLPQIVPV